MDMATNYAAAGAELNPNPYEQIFNELEDLIFVVNEEGELLKVNRALLRRLGYAEEQLKGMTVLDLYAPDRKGEALAIVEQLSIGKEIRCQIPLLAVSGETVDVASRLFRADFNGIPAFFGICRDITPLRNRESDAMKSKAQLTALLDNIPFCAWMKDEAGRYIAVNKAFLGICDKPAETILGKTDYDIWPESLARKYDADDQYAIRLGKQLSLEEFIMHGEVLEWVETHKTPIIDATGKRVGIAGISQVVTEQRRLQQELKGQKRFLKAMMDAIPDLIFCKDTDSVYLGCNAAFSEKFIGLSEKEIIGLTDSDFIKDQEQAAFFRQKDREMLEAGVPVTNEERVVLADGTEVELETMKTPFFDEEGRVSGLIGVSRDITARKKAEQELVAARQSAEAANIMKGQFLANMSHEIRTPMNGILGFLDLLGRTALNESQRSYLMEARSASEILLYLINDILDFSKIEAGGMILESRQFALREVLENTVALMAPKTDGGPVIDIRLADNLPHTVIGDPYRLKQVLTNLLSNAVKFTDKGIVRLSAERINPEESTVALHFSVSDTGVGIREEDLKLLFRPFTQADASTSRKYGGSGLGLSISRELTRLMGGDIWAESTLGVGSTFHFVVRLQPVEMLPGEDTPSELSIPCPSQTDDGHAGSAPRILLAEDNHINSMLMAVMLENRGLEWDIATDGAEAVAAFRRCDYELILMDCQMPGMDGYEATRIIRREEAGRIRPVIVAMTANAMVGDREKCLRAGMDDYLSKPISQDSFYGILDKYFPASKPAVEPDLAIPDNAPERPGSFNEAVRNVILDMGLDREDAIQLISGYIKKLPNLMEELEGALSAQDTGKLNGVLHRLIGTSGNLRLQSLHALAIALQTACAESRTDTCQSALHLLKREVLSLLYADR